MIVGCSSKSEKAIENLVSSEEGEFTIVTFHKKLPSGDFQDSIGEIAMANMGRINKVAYIRLGKNSDQEYDYETILQIKEYPQMIVFDNKGSVLETNKVEEIKSFFENVESIE